MSSVKNLSVTYDATNKNYVFHPGDYLTGQITLELSQECKVQSLFIKMKGNARVLWNETYGDKINTYYNNIRYFSIKQCIIQESLGNNIIAPGCHVYPFTFQIPAGELPSSFIGTYGKILYTLKAVLSRPMRVNCKATEIFTVIHKESLGDDSILMTAQHGTVAKKMKVFSSGSVSMDVNITRKAFHQGDGIKVVAYIQNKSSRGIKPKYCLYEKHSYFANRKRKVSTYNLLKEVGEVIPPSSSQTVTRIITIPSTTRLSILNGNIIAVEHRLKVYLDVKYASDPEIKFPIVILAAI